MSEDDIFERAEKEFRDELRARVRKIVRDRARRAELTGGERVALHPRHIVNHIKAALR